MKKLFMFLPLVFLLCFTFACQDKEAMAEHEAMKAKADLEEQNKALYLRWLEEDAKGKYEILEEVCAPDYKYYYPSNANPITFEEYLQEWKMTKNAFPDLKYTIDDIIAKDDKVVSRLIIRGTHTEELMGMQPTGKEFEYSYIEIIRFSEGRAVEGWGEGDMLGLMQQLGTELKPKEGGEIDSS